MDDALAALAAVTATEEVLFLLSRSVPARTGSLSGVLAYGGDGEGDGR